MKRTIFKGVLFLFIFLLMTACGNDANEKDNDQDTGGAPPANETENNEAEEAGDVDPLGKFADTVTVTQVIGYSEPQDPETPQGLTPQENGYVEQLKEMLNINLEYLWTVPTAQFEQKFSVAIASGDLPDMMALDLAQFEKFRQQGILADLTDVYDTYASDTLKGYLESDGGRTLDLFTYDGELLGLPSYEDPYMSTQMVWLRQDWLDNLGLEIPESLEELESVAEAFVNDDPNQSGQNDTYGIAFHKELFSWGFDARGLFYTMGAYPEAWTVGDNGELVPGEIQPETKAALGKLSDWYEKGILDKEFALKDIDKAVEDVVAGKVGISFGEWWYPEWPLNMTKDNDANADWISIELPTFNGEKSKSLVPSMRLDRVLVATTQLEKPEALIKMANLYHELLLPEYDELNTPKNGFVYNWYEPRIYNPANIDDQYVQVNAALDAGKDTIESTNSEVPGMFEHAQKFLGGDESSWGPYTARVAEDGGWGLVRKIKGSGQVVFDEYAGTATPTMTSKGSSLDKITAETFTKIIMGSSPLDEFDKYVESWKKLGGDDITAEVNEWYKEHGNN